MSTVTKTYCDACALEVNSVNKVRVEISGFQHKNLVITKDVCDKCLVALGYVQNTVCDTANKETLERSVLSFIKGSN